MKRTVTGMLLAAAWMIAGAVAPARAIDLYGFASYWGNGDLEGKGGFGVGLGMPLISEHLILDGRVYFLDKSSLAYGDEVTMVPFDLGLQLHLMPRSDLDPYGLAGVSFIYADADRSDVDSSFGAYLGAGLEWAPISFLRLFGEGVYRFQKLDGSRGSDIDVGGLSGNVGIRIYF
ncbi:MAG: porin family protein [Desulfobulbus sp.]|uniref:outer membrane beta-barrel protein n=1 Tax=Desulfobulbus sp. TaxID=895 RepID=UPI002848E5C4|nr:outer membrane beta-barrel protein [Desulfobulbus sp.]MDR2550250.1 porin family protein [Desulfobulbus sp.]